MGLCVWVTYRGAFCLSAKDNFTFKCHRSNGTNTSAPQDIYAVNGIAFHPVHGTLATVGSDGRFSFWDKDARTKLKTSEQLDQPIAACCFNHNGNIFAYASSYDWSKVGGPQCRFLGPVGGCLGALLAAPALHLCCSALASPPVPSLPIPICSPQLWAQRVASWASPSALGMALSDPWPLHISLDCLPPPAENLSGCTGHSLRSQHFCLASS